MTLAGTPLGRGGQGPVYVAPHDNRLVIKVWDPEHRTPEAAQRAAALCRWSRRDPRLGLPVELALDGPQGNVVGFVMPRLPGVQLLAAFNPAAARHQGIEFEPAERLLVAAMLADLFDAIHTAHFLVADANEGNFLVERRWLGWQVYGIDCDSYVFEARDSAGRFRRFETEVGKEEYLAPELQGQNPGSVAHTLPTDLFALAVLLWLLLKGGAHPFAVKSRGTAGVPPLGERIREGCWPHDPVRPLPAGWQPVDVGIPWSALPKDVRELFIRAFRDGHTDPLERPHASEWRDALTAWVRQERSLASTAHRILSAFRSLARAQAASWLLGRIARLPGLFGWNSKAKEGPQARRRFLVRAAIIAVILSLALYGLFQERGKKGTLNARSLVPRWAPKWIPKLGENKEDDELWRGAPPLWKELADE